MEKLIFKFRKSFYPCQEVESSKVVSVECMKCVGLAG